MTKQKREIFSFSKEKRDDDKFHFRRLRKKRPSKKLWLLIMMSIALGYLILTLKSKM